MTMNLVHLLDNVSKWKTKDFLFKLTVFIYKLLSSSTPK